ncbi:MAG TPA: Hpt domain-containing protein, partial [Thermoanaerobaculia bacterium]
MRDPLLAALFGDFLLESRERLDHLEEILLEAAAAGLLGTGVLEEIRLELHTLKGNAGLVGLAAMQIEAHTMEDLVAALSPGEPPPPELLAGIDRMRLLLREAEAEETGEAARDLTSAAVQGGARVAFATLDTLVDRLEEMVIFRSRLAEALETQRRELGSAARTAA